MRSKLLEYIFTLHKCVLGRLMLLKKFRNAGIVTCVCLQERGHEMYFDILNFSVNLSLKCNLKIC